MMRIGSSKLWSLLAAAGHTAIVTHERPDGDAIGSCFALRRILGLAGKPADILLAEPPPERYALLGVSPGDANYAADPTRYDLCVCLDSSSEKRLAFPPGLKLADFADAKVVNIDHHPDNEMFGDYQLVDSKAAATAALVAALAGGRRGAPAPDAFAATMLTLGLLMDTGGFRFQNTDGKTLRLAARLLAAGADYQGIVNAMFYTVPANLLRLQSDLVANHLQVECGGRHATAHLAAELLEKHQVSLADCEGVIDILRSIAGVEVASLLYPKENGFKLSLRSKNRRYPVGGIARELDGGGHELAAGGFIATTDYENAAAIVSAKVAALLDGKPGR